MASRAELPWFGKVDFRHALMPSSLNLETFGEASTEGNRKTTNQ
jgi:hypothetical protein